MINAAIAILLLASQQQNIDPKIFTKEGPEISYSTGPKSAVLVAGELSKLLGVELRVNPVLAEEVIVMKAPKQHSGDILNAFASCVIGKWDPITGILQPDGAGLAAMQQKFAAERLTLYKKSYDKAFKAASEAPDTDLGKRMAEIQKRASDEKDPQAQMQAYRELMSLRKQLPDQRLGIRLLGLVGLQNIAAVPFGSRAVYSTNPTRMQRPINGSALMKLVDQAIAESASYIQSNPTGAPGDDEDSMNYYVYQTDGIARIAKQRQSITKALVVIQNAGSGFIFDMQTSVVLKLINNKNQVVHQLDLGNMLDLNEEMMEQTGDLEKEMTDPKAKVLKVSDEAKAFSVYLMTRTQSRMGYYSDGNEDPVPQNNKFDQIIGRPDIYEPISMTAGGILTEYLETIDGPVAVTVPDLFATISQYIMNQPTVPVALMKYALEMMDNKETDRVPGWTMFTPKMVRNGRTRTSRVELARLLGNIAETGFANARPYTHYTLFASDEPEYMSFPSFYMSAMSYSSDMMTMQNKDISRFVGMLTDDQWKQLTVDGKQIRFGDLSSQQKSHLVDAVFNSPDEVLSYQQEIEGDGAIPGVDEAPVAVQAQMAQSVRGYMGEEGVQELMEPTEMLAQGIPADAIISISTAEDSTLLAFSSTEGVSPRFMRPEEYGMGRGMLTDPRALKQYLYIGAINRFRVCTHRSYTLNIQLTPKLSIYGSFQDVINDKNAPIVPMDQLPPAIRASIEEAEKDAKKQIASQGEMPDGMPVPEEVPVRDGPPLAFLYR